MRASAVVRSRRGIVRRVVFYALVVVAFVGGAADADATTNLVALPLCCIPSGPVHALAVSGNTAYVGGSFTHLGLAHHHLALLDPTTGQPQDGWPGVDGGFVTTAIPDGSGGWYIAGDFTSVGGIARAGLAHLSSDKSVDPSWAPTTNGTVKALARDTAGVVYAGGSFSQVNGGTARSNVAAFDASGQVTSFTADTDGQVNALATSFRFSGPVPTVTPVARLFIGGAFTNVAGSAHHYFAAVDLSNDTLAGGDANLTGSVSAIAVSDGGALTARVAYVSGAFTGITSPSLARNHLAAFQEDGATATSWAPAVDTAPTVILPNGSNVYLGGVGVVNGTARAGVAEVDDNTGTLQPWAPVVEGPGGAMFLAIRGMAVIGNAVYVGGRIGAANGVERNNLAALDATTGQTLGWDPDAPGFHPGVTAVASDGTSLLASGGFNEIGGPARSNLAAIDLSTGQVTGFAPQVDGEVDSLALQGSTLYIGGVFTHVGGSVRHNAAAVDTSSGVPTAFDPNTDGMVDALAPAGSTVFLGGSFAQVGGSADPGLAGVDAQSGALTSFHDELDNTAYALAYKDGTLYVGGPFHHIAGVARNGFAAVLTQSGQVMPFDPQFDDYTGALLVHGNTLYVSGHFQHVLNNIPRAYMAAFDTTNLSLLPFDPGLDTLANALAEDDSELFVAGGFTSLSGAARPGAGAVDFASGLGNAWAPSFVDGAAVDAVALSRDGGVVFGGDATFISGDGVLEAFAISPSTPAAPQATSDAPGQATVSFAAPANGGSAITQYTVSADPGGATATGAGSPITVPGLAPGTTYSFRVAAANAAGQGPASDASNPVTIASAQGQPPAPPSGGGGTTLRASAFKVTHKRFAVGKARTALTARKTPTGTTFSFKLSAAATSRITIAQRLRGAKKGKRCVAPYKRARKHCTRLKKVGTLTRKRTRAGTNKIRFSGRLGKRALHPGSYQATLVATDVAGRHSKAVTLTFVVVRARKR